jgi:hypothetical protein
VAARPATGYRESQTLFLFYHCAGSVDTDKDQSIEVLPLLALIWQGRPAGATIRPSLD